MTTLTPSSTESVTSEPSAIRPGEVSDSVQLARLLGRAIAALLFLAALWFALYAFNISRPAPLSFDFADGGPDAIREFFDFWRPLAWQESGFGLLAALAFLLVAPFGRLLAELLAPGGAMARTAATLFIVASCLLVAAQLVPIGVQQVVNDASELEWADPVALLHISDTGYAISTWLETGGYLAMALGLAAWAMVARRLVPLPTTWRALSYGLAIALVVVVLAQLGGLWAISDVALAVAGAVLAPIWFLLSARVVEATASPLP